MPEIKTPMIVIYSSLDCGHLFCTPEMDSGDAYPTQVVYHCPVCKRQHSFNVKASYLVTTPLKKTAFEMYCNQVGITDFDVYVK